MKASSKTPDRRLTTNGFTLLESLMAVFFLGLMAAGVTAVYSSGYQSLDDQMDSMLLDSKVRSRMEVLVGTEFGSLSSNSEVVTINGKNYTINWSVATVDLSGDGISEPTAKKVTVSVDGTTSHALTTILVDNEKKVGKIS
jgi:type II secretory pathway pseudopilin PulG